MSFVNRIESVQISIGYSEAVNLRTENIMTKWKGSKGQTMIYKVLHRKLQLSEQISNNE